MPLAPLSHYPVARTSNPGRLRDAVDSLTGYGHSVEGAEARSDHVHGTVNGLRLDGFSLVFVAYAAPVRVVAPPTRDRVVLVVPLGPMRVETAGRSSWHTSPFALSSSAETTMFPDPNAGALVGAVEVSALMAALREGFGEEREFAVDLAQARPLPLNAGPALHRVWADFAGHPSSDPAQLLDRLVIGLAPYTSYGHGPAGGRAGMAPAAAQPTPGRTTPPPYLTHAVRYLRRHLADPISVTELGSVVGIGSRQLQLAFQEHLGWTAQEYLRNVRLDRAWSLLRNRPDGADSGRTVAAVAAEVGIPHSGRFSQYFFERFGVHPSALRGP